MRIIDNVYADTLFKIIKDLMAQIADSESFVNDDDSEDDDYKQKTRGEIPKLIKLVTPAIINLSYAFHLFVDDEIKDFIKKYSIQVTEEKYESRETYANVFKKWVGEVELVSKGELEISEDFCTFLDSHYDEELLELMASLSDTEPVNSKEKNALDIIISGLEDVEAGSGEKQNYLEELKSLRSKL